MPKTKAVILGFLVALVPAACAASASAAGWMVNGASLTGSQALATTAAVDANSKLTAAGVTIECTGSTLNAVAPQIEASNKGSASSLEFTDCVATPSTCTLSSSTISTEPITVEATLEGSLAVVATFKPTAGSVFTTIDFGGSLCALEGVQPIIGHAKVLAPTGRDERTVQLINVITEATSGELKLGSSAATLEGSALLKLANSEAWSLL